MEPLESLKEKLKQKPIVQPNQGVKVMLMPSKVEITTEGDKKPIITAQRDSGEKAKDILEKIKQKKLSLVTKKFPEETREAVIVEKAPVLKESKKPVFKKLKKEMLPLEEEDETQLVVPLPEGGPRVEEDIDEKQGDDEPKEPLARPKTKPRERITPKITSLPSSIQSNTSFPINMNIQIGDTTLAKRLPQAPSFDVKVSSYYMNNREIFVNFINGLFSTYKDDLMDETKDITCDDIGKDSGTVSLLTHQKIVRDYINLYTPYRGLLLYHGLGSGKTCSSVAIAEGMKSSKKVIIMTPASLRRNYMEEIKKCGDLIYRKNQFWEWISTDDNVALVQTLSVALGLHPKYITRNRGAWLVNIKKPSNYTELSSNDKKVLNDQLDEMIKNKYIFINHNGLRREQFRQMTDDFTKNIFDNAVVIIDEAHNLISKIVNKINKMPKFSEKKRNSESNIIPQSLSLILYEFLLKAEGCRIVLLTGTPIINYPNEIAILFNILRGYIKTWSFTLDTNVSHFSKETLQTIFAKEKILDYIDYVPSSKTLTVTRNPYGFENKITSTGYKGVTNEKKEKKNDAGVVERDANGDIVMEERGTMDDSEFVKRIVKLLKKNDVTAVPKGTTYNVNTALPDTLDEFINNFINKETGVVTNTDKFKRRILGLTSYFRSAQEELLPAYDKDADRHIVNIPMSDYQFRVYENYRREERKTEKSKKKGSTNIVDKDGVYMDAASSYRIFSRLACNFAMPTPPGRPTPAQYKRIMETKKQEQLFDWMKERHFKNNDEHDEYMREKVDVLKELIHPIHWDDKIVYVHVIQPLMDEYLNLYFTQNYRESMENFFKTKAPILFTQREMPEEELNRLVHQYSDKHSQAEEKEEKARQKAEEKEEKARKKAEEKEEKARQKAEEKEEKARQKAEEKEEKARRKAEKKEEKARQKAEKKKKGGAIDDDDDTVGGAGDNEENDDGENPAEEKDDGENPAEEFIDSNQDDRMEHPVILTDYKDEDAILREVDELEGDEILETMGSVEFKEAMKQALLYVQKYSQEFLTPEGLKIYSPKFLTMLENIQDPEYKGLHLVYSQFRSMEGIAIFSLVLEANGFAKFKIRRDSTNNWELNMSEEDMGKPCYALYTGTEDAEEREIIRNIYNGAWDYIPNNIAAQLRAKSSNNNMGEIIKVLMITSAGSEGINLKNTRYVHIMESYWQPVRIEQVIGRARRICSHQSLPKELQTVVVFIYIMVFTEKQLDSDYSKELRLKDLSKIAPYVPQTSDQKLFEIMSIKEKLTTQLLKAIKESSIDCATHVKSNSKEGLVCLSFGQPKVDDFSYNPYISQDQNDTVANLNKARITWTARPFTHPVTNKVYMLRTDTNQLYDYDSVIQAQQVPGVTPILVGKLVKLASGKYEMVKEVV